MNDADFCKAHEKWPIRMARAHIPNHDITLFVIQGYQISMERVMVGTCEAGPRENNCLFLVERDGCRLKRNAMKNWIRILGICFFLVLPRQIVLSQTRVVTPNPAFRVHSGASWNAATPPGVRLVSARNASATAPVVVTGVTRAVPALISDLRHEQGLGVFPSRLLELRYGWTGLGESPEACPLHSRRCPHASWRRNQHDPLDG